MKLSQLNILWLLTVLLRIYLVGEVNAKACALAYISLFTSNE